jgi:hypothetical protein
MKSFAVFAVAVMRSPVGLAEHRIFAVNPYAGEVKMTLNPTREVVNGTFHIPPRGPKNTELSLTD